MRYHSGTQGRRERVSVVAGVLYNSSVRAPPVQRGQDERVASLDESVQRYFTPKARRHLQRSPLQVARHGDSSFRKSGVTIAGSYDPRTGIRYVDEGTLQRGKKDIESTVFHESVHHLDFSGLIDRDEFMKAYNMLVIEPSESVRGEYRKEIQKKIGNNRQITRRGYQRIREDAIRKACKKERYYPVKAAVENAVKHYDPHRSDLTAERIAYTAQLWRMQGFDIPPEIKRVFERVIVQPSNIHKLPMPLRVAA